MHSSCFSTLAPSEALPLQRRIGAGERPEGWGEVDGGVDGGCRRRGSHLQRHLVHRLAVAQVAVLVELRRASHLRGQCSLRSAPGRVLKIISQVSVLIAMSRRALLRGSCLKAQAFTPAWPTACIDWALCSYDADLASTFAGQHTCCLTLAKTRVSQTAHLVQEGRDEHPGQCSLDVRLVGQEDAPCKHRQVSLVKNVACCLSSMTALAAWCSWCACTALSKTRSRHRHVLPTSKICRA